MEVDEKPTEEYTDIGGLDKQIQELVEAIVIPMTHRERFEKIGIRPPKVGDGLIVSCVGYAFVKSKVIKLQDRIERQSAGEREQARGTNELIYLEARKELRC